MRFAETELTRSECERANARTARTDATVGAKRALNTFDVIAPVLPAAWRASSASRPLRGASATVTDMERAWYAPTRLAPFALIGAAPGTAFAATAVGAATAPSASTAGTTKRVLLRMQAPSEGKRARPGLTGRARDAGARPALPCPAGGREKL